MIRARLRTCAALVVAATAAACSGASSGPSSAAEVATFRVAPRDLRVSVTEKGALKTAKQILVQPEIPGAAKIVWLVGEGALVKAGDVLCELDPTEKAKEVDDLANRVVQLQGQLTAAEAELSIQLSQNDADVSDAELKHHFAEVKLERFEKAEYVQERKKREVRVEKAKSDVARTTKRYEQMPALLKEGFVTAEQVEEERIRMVEAVAELALAQLDLDSYERYTAGNDREQKQADVRSSKLEIGRAKQRATAREAQKRAEVERHRSELANVRSSLELARGVLGKMTIRAPGNGVVIYGDTRNPWDFEQRNIKVGSLVSAGNTLFTLPDLAEMHCAVTIHEADIARIRQGQKAFVVVESADQTQLEGEVTRVAQVAVRDWESYDRNKRFEVEIKLRGDTARLELKPGMTARVEILVGERQGVLAVPVQAVFAQRGRFFVFARRDGAAARTVVDIEDGNAQFAIVRSGLAEGDEILLVNPEEGSADGAVAPATAGASEGAGEPPRGKP